MSSSARRALKILAAVGGTGRPMGVTEIARAVGIAPGTAFRGIDALQGANLLTRDVRAPRYALGPAALGLRQSLLAQFRIRDVAMPYLRQLASATGETTGLYVRIGWYVVCVAKAPGNAEMTSDANLSGFQPLSTHVAGRVILAHLERAQLSRYRAWASPRGIVIERGLERELGQIRARGLARAFPPESGGLAFPIRKLDQAFAALVVEGASAPENRPAPQGQNIAEAVEALIRANPALSHQPFAHFDPDELELPS